MEHLKNTKVQALLGSWIFAVVCIILAQMLWMPFPALSVFLGLSGVVGIIIAIAFISGGFEE